MRKRRFRGGRHDAWGGILLIGLGAFLLMVQFDVIRAYRIWDWWPLWPLTIGLWKLVRWESPQQLGGGVTLTLIGVWLMIANFGWFGMTWRDSWPLSLVAVGAGITTRAIATALQRDKDPEPGTMGTDTMGSEPRHD